MEIKLKDEEKTLTITDKGFDSPLMWLRLTIVDESVGDSAVRRSQEVDIPLRDLMSAVIAFDSKRRSKQGLSNQRYPVYLF